MLLGKVEGPPVLNGKIGRAAVEAVCIVASSLPIALRVRHITSSYDTDASTTVTHLSVRSTYSHRS